MSTPETLHSLAIRWQGDRLELLDQRLLPEREDWLELTGAGDTAEAIRHMVVRGAPAIGIAAAYGLALEALRQGDNASRQSLDGAMSTLRGSRPTAVNLFWALDRMAAVMATQSDEPLAPRLVREALVIHREDQQLNQALARHGAELLPEPARIYTHCNTGALATGGHGTALGIIRTAHDQGRLAEVFAGETRPWFQGSRLTVWELMQAGIPATLVTDSCAGSLMQAGRVNAVVVGADRITANGDVANKIGTYSLAVLARHHGLPFIVAAPSSTLDVNTASGAEIQIEERDASEISGYHGKALAPGGARVFNPAFDITPAALVTALVTERGVIREPAQHGIQGHLEG
jgi:methylthioribose-1-phosphate isomerase